MSASTSSTRRLNATQAAIRAGYSRKTARSMGAENLTKPERRIEMIGKHVDVQAFRERTAHEIEPVVPVLNITLEREANGK